MVGGLGPQACSDGNGQLGLYTNSPANVQVANGMLRIIAQNTGTGGNYNLSSARVSSMNIDDCSGEVITTMTSSFVTVNGAVEWRARIPQGTGLWPALWLLPKESDVTGSPVYGNWPYSGEVDVLENNGAEQNYVAQSLHYYNGDFQSGANVNDVTQWHVYRLEWFTNQIVWMVDGVTNNSTSTWTPPPGYAYPRRLMPPAGDFTSS